MRVTTIICLSMSLVIVSPKALAFQPVGVQPELAEPGEVKLTAEPISVVGPRVAHRGSNEITNSAESTTLLVQVAGDGLATHQSAQQKSLIDFRNPQSIDNHRPIVVAHRGGVVTSSSPECSLTAIELAAKQGYDMVELDIRVSQDGVPIVFHDRSLAEACGRKGTVASYSANELESIRYLASDDQIARLDTALNLCRQRKLGVMLDLKAGRNSVNVLKAIRRLLAKHNLVHSTITFSGSPAARRTLQGVRFTPTEEEMRRLRNGEKLDLSNRFWFGLPQRLQTGDIKRLKAAGALIIPAINTFRYPTDQHWQLAKEDIQQLTEQGVDGFQIDSIYYLLLEDVD